MAMLETGNIASRSEQCVVKDYYYLLFFFALGYCLIILLARLNHV